MTRLDPVLADARDRLRRLKASNLAGTLAAAKYESERRTVEREIGDHLVAGIVDVDASGRPSRSLVGAIAVAVLALAAAGYWKTGSPSMASVHPVSDTVRRVATGSPESADAGASGAGASGQQQIAAMVDTLAERMKTRPDDAQGWIMLARSYTVLSRFDEALPAYKRASELQPQDAVLLADYADAVAATKGSANNAESNALIDRALAIDPKQPKALALAGTSAYDRGDFAGAVSRWEAMAADLPPDSELSKQVRSSIDDARQRMGAAGTAPPPAVPPPRTAAADASATSVSGTVTLAPALAGQVSAGDTVFVFARAAGGGRMPLAVRRATVADLPLTFKLDDSMAMAPGATISSARQLIVGARISKSGNAIPQAGDLSGEVTPVAPGATGLAIRIDSVVSPR